MRGSTTYKICVEDARSIELKAALAEKYGLAGTAAYGDWVMKNPRSKEVLFKKIKA